MKMAKMQLPAIALIAFALNGACVPMASEASQAAPQAAPQAAQNAQTRRAIAGPAARTVQAPPALAPAIAPESGTSLLDAPQTPGNWSYRDAANSSAASFAKRGQMPVLVITCDKMAKRVRFVRRVEKPSNRAVWIETETVRREAQAEPLGKNNVRWQFDGRDPVLDAMAFSKGRFAVAVAGEKPLLPPSWTEVSRVIEDCR